MAAAFITLFLISVQVIFIKFLFFFISSEKILSSCAFTLYFIPNLLLLPKCRGKKANKSTVKKKKYD